jgi:hypothetical protein
MLDRRERESCGKVKMSDQERLLQVSQALDMPIQVSSTDGATRSMVERIEEVRQEDTAATPGSCGMSWSGWGN